MTPFTLHPRLAQDCIVVGRMPLCLLLLMNDSHYPWFILVPQRQPLTEIHHLPEAEQQQLMRESSALAQAMETLFSPDKLNVAALGNIVPQLHIHHIARFQQDDAWPGPVWGKYPATPYEPEQADSICVRMREQLQEILQ